MPAAQLNRTDLSTYSMSNAEDIYHFLDAHKDLERILVDAPARIERSFGKSLPLRLKLFRDHDDPAAVELVVEIIVGPNWSVSEHALDRLHSDWLSGLPRRISSSILFVVEPR